MEMVENGMPALVYTAEMAVTTCAELVQCQSVVATADVAFGLNTTGSRD